MLARKETMLFPIYIYKRKRKLHEGGLLLLLLQGLSGKTFFKKWKKRLAYSLGSTTDIV
jgi:hypothetical protein